MEYVASEDEAFSESNGSVTAYLVEPVAAAKHSRAQSAGMMGHYRGTESLSRRGSASCSEVGSIHYEVKDSKTFPLYDGRLRVSAVASAFCLGADRRRLELACGSCLDAAADGLSVNTLDHGQRVYVLAGSMQPPEEDPRSQRPAAHAKGGGKGGLMSSHASGCSLVLWEDMWPLTTVCSEASRALDWLFDVINVDQMLGLEAGEGGGSGKGHAA